jgi:hypothetical protein
MRIKIDVDTKAALEVLHRRMRNMLPTCRKALEQWGDAALAVHRVERLSGRPGLIPNKHRLQKSFLKKTSGRTLDTLQITLYSSRSRFGYAHVHERGMHIYPKVKAWMRFKVYTGDKTPSGRKRTTWVFTKHVFVPPRLKFVSTIIGYKWNLQQRAQNAMRQLWERGVLS